MTVDIQSEAGRVIRRFIPLSTLPSAVFAKLCEQFDIEQAEEGRVLFKRGEACSDLFYLLDGAISLEIDGLNIETIAAGSESARFAIAHQIPRKVDVVARGRIQFLRLDADMMKSIKQAGYDENESTMMVEELEDNDDWVTTLLKSPIFRGLPPANLQRILMSLESIEFKAGSVVIRQGDPGDYYYIIKKGRGLISRKPTPNAKDIKLAQLADLDTFGEDALISGEPRNVSVTALTDMSMLRLGKEQFITLIKQPSLKYVNFDELQTYLKEGAELLDVRSSDEYNKAHLPQSINVPFFSLRMYLKTLNRQQPIIVVCNDGRSSESAAFLLLRNKFNALILKGGIAAVSAEQLKVPASFKIDDGIETGNFTEQERDATAMAQLESQRAQQESATLRQLANHLKAKCTTLEAEKNALELKYTTLLRQAEVLRGELEDLKKRRS